MLPNRTPLKFPIDHLVTWLHIMNTKEPDARSRALPCHCEIEPLFNNKLQVHTYLEICSEKSVFSYYHITTQQLLYESIHIKQGRCLVQIGLYYF